MADISLCTAGFVTFVTSCISFSQFRYGCSVSVDRERYPLTSQLIQENNIPEFGGDLCASHYRLLMEE